jgi:hypothetical protein
MNRIKKILRKTIKISQKISEKIIEIFKKIMLDVLRYLYIAFIKIKKLYKKLNKIGKGMFIVLGILILYLLYILFFSSSIYNNYVLVDWNGVKLAGTQKVNIEKEKISGYICGDWSGALKDENKTLVSQVSLVNATCSQLDLGLQYSFMYGLQSGLKYSFKNGQVILLDESRRNVFVLEKE